MFRLVAHTTATDNSQPKVWQERTASFVRPTELAFLVFEVTAEYDWLEYLAGLYIEYTEKGYIVAGTINDFVNSIKIYDTNDYPHDVRKFYGYVRQKIRDFGYKAV